MTMYGSRLMSTGSSEVSGSPTLASGVTMSDEARRTDDGDTPPVRRQVIDRGVEALGGGADDNDKAEMGGGGDGRGKRNTRSAVAEPTKEQEEDLEILSPSSDEGEDGDDANTEDEKNEALSQAELSSVGSVGAEAPPPTRSLVFLGETLCRIPMSCKQPAGDMVLAYCGSLAVSCSHRGHKAKQMSQAHSRGSVAYYSGVGSPRSSRINGRKDLRCYSVEEYGELKALEDVDLEALGDGFAETHEGDNDAEDGVPEEYDHGDRVRFDLSTPPNPSQTRDPPIVETVTSTDSSASYQHPSGTQGELRDNVAHERRCSDIPSSVETGSRTGSRDASQRVTRGRPVPGSGDLAGIKTRSSGVTSAGGRPSYTGPQIPLGSARSTIGNTKPQKRRNKKGAGILPVAQDPSDSEDSEETNLFIYGLLNSNDFNLPRLEENRSSALLALDQGWVLKRQFTDWPTALEWFNKQLTRYRSLIQIQANIRPAPPLARTTIDLSRGVAPIPPISLEGVAAPPATIQGPEHRAQTTTSKGYIGLERPEPFHRVCIRESDQMYAEIQGRIDEGYKWVLRLPDIDTARDWVQQGQPSIRSQTPSDLPRPTSLSGQDSAGNYNNNAPPMFMVSSDQSAGDDSKIFGLDVVDQDGIDKALAPGGLQAGKDMMNLYERVMDVAALPGPSVGTEDGNDNKDQLQDVMEITALVITQATTTDKTGRGMTFKSRTNNPLIHVKTELEIMEMPELVRKAAEEDLKTQTKQLRAFMHKRGYQSEYIATFVDSGGLPRMIRRSVELYKSLIEAVIQALRSFSEGSWKDSYAQAMLYFWANKLASSRKRAVDYRDHVIDVYIILRDAERKRFQDESFHRVMWKRFELLEASVATNVNRETPPANVSGNRCGHCRHRLGHEAGQCPLHDFKSNQAASLLNNISGKAKCIRLISIFKGLVNATSSDVEIAAAVTTARAEVG
jgi:hypothetical protein